MSSTECTISKDSTKLDLDLIFNYLSSSYWAKGRTRSQVEKSIKNSMCFGVYLGDTQVGFARVISDVSTFAYIADVFIVESHQGLGYGKKLMRNILSDQELQEVQGWYLITKDAQTLYQQFGFEAFDYSKRTMMTIPHR